MNKYIKRDNKKAVDFLTAKGYTLTPGVKTYYSFNGGDNIPVADTDVYWVNYPGSGKVFHKFLVNNGLI